MKLTALQGCVLLSLLCHAAGFAAYEIFLSSAPVEISPASTKSSGYTILIAPPETESRNSRLTPSATPPRLKALKKIFFESRGALKAALAAPRPQPLASGKIPAPALPPDEALAAGFLVTNQTATNDVVVGAHISRVFATANVQPDYLKIPKPEYPSAARRDRAQGTVLLRVHVTERGQPDRIEVLRSSGAATLDDAAVRAVRGWEFTPAQMRDEAVESEIDFPIQFKLDRAE